MSATPESFSREDQFAAAIEQARANEAPQTDNAPEKPESPQPSTPEAEPFEGFNALPETAREHYRQLASERSNFAAERDRYRQEQSALAGRVPGLQRELAQLKKAQAASVPSPAQQRTLDKYEEFKKRFPEDGEAIEERFAAVESRLGDPKLGNRLETIEARLAQWDARLENEAVYAAQEQLTEAHPDWQVIAGMVDASGKAIPAEQQQFHPEFTAWAQALPQWKRDHYQHLMTETRDTDAHAAILSEFKADYAAALEAEEAQGKLPARRQAALDDVSPTGSGGNGLDGTNRGPDGRFQSSREDDYAETVNRFRDSWQKGR